MEKKRDKILLVQLYSNGDCLYATTVAQQIKKDFPGLASDEKIKILQFFAI